MKISVGYSVEVAGNDWAKGDIEIDASDLERLLMEKDITADLTHSQTYAIMSLEAERLATLDYITALKVRSIEPPSAVLNRARSLKDAVESKLGSLNE